MPSLPWRSRARAGSPRFGRVSGWHRLQAALCAKYVPKFWGRGGPIGRLPLPEQQVIGLALHHLAALEAQRLCGTAHDHQMVHGCEAKMDLGSRVTEQAIKIRKEDQSKRS
jgi:hypothetical protein